MGFPGGSVAKNPPANAGDAGLIPGSGRSPGEENDNPLQCSCLENPRGGGAWWAAVYGVAQSQTRLKRLSRSSSRHDCQSSNDIILFHVYFENLHMLYSMTSFEGLLI